MKTRSLIILVGGLALLVAITVFLNNPVGDITSSVTQTITQVAPDTQTAGFFKSIGKFFKKVAKAIANVISPIWCQAFTGGIQNAFGPCPGGGSGGSGGGPGGRGGGFWQEQGNPPETGNQQPQNGNAPGVGGGAGGEICNSAPNACGMVSTGFINQGGQCGATTPPLSACPAPVIGATGFYAEPARVKSGNTSTLHWNVTNATQCAITGGGISLVGLGVAGQNQTNPITKQTTFTLTCENGAAGGPSGQASAVVNIIPTFQEI